MAETLRDLDITREEVDRIGEALKNEEFRKLLLDYCEELTDPETRKQYEKEITELEKERGVDVTFINPEPGYVIKTSLDGSKIAFINVCSNENVLKPSSKPSTQVSEKGMDWSVPHLLSPPRDDLNKKGKRCTVYDVIFHPDVFIHVSRNTQFRNLVNNIACEAIASNYNIKLDIANLKFPKMKYKGMARPLVIRKRNGMVVDKAEENETPIDKLYSDMYKKMDENMPVANTVETKVDISASKSPYTTPKYLIKHRSDVDIQDFTNQTTSRVNAAIPKQLIIEVNLPLLKSSSDLALDVTEKTVSLISEKPSKYKLNLTLPYFVNEDLGNAKFDQDHRKLVITLPVKRNCNLLLSDIGRDDSGVDSDSSPITDNSACDISLPLIEELNIEDNESKSDCSLVSASDVYRTRDETPCFLNPDFHYSLPESSCHLFNNILVFTLHVKNIDSTSLEKVFNENASALHIKFSSISPAYFPVHYSFYVYLPLHFIDTDNVSIETWDNNVVAQIAYTPSDKPVSTYWAGTSEECTEEKVIEEPSMVFNKHFNRKMDQVEDITPNVQVEKTNDEVTIIINPEKSDDDSETSSSNSNQESMKKDMAKPNNSRSRCYSESSGDDLSVSPTKGILKMGRSHTPISRSVSESTADDYIWSSFENCASVSDSFIPEEGEVSTSVKKTVRFKEEVSQQLFRHNSSILGQKKKNQRKSRNKKRAQERRVSESENSEGDDKKDKNNSSDDLEKYAVSKTKDEHEAKLKIDFKSDLIFDIDM